MIPPEKSPLEERMQRNDIHENDLEERFVLGSGSGGQKINKTANCVYLKHVPTGIEVSCQDSRSREKNREIARQRLCEQIEEQRDRERLRKARERARKRYQKRRPSVATKAKMRRTKEHRREKKQARGRVRE
ncbi:MAG: peptide chain release factor-like protein [Verrucomicrobiales bacterium]|jgi:protein subunit release factor B|nr:peptide chain release factor-like protein [Verrucomicrobiales bacterium]